MYWGHSILVPSGFLGMVDEGILSCACPSVSESMAREGDDHSCLQRRLLSVAMLVVRIFPRRGIRLLVLVEVHRM